MKLFLILFCILFIGAGKSPTLKIIKLKGKVLDGREKFTPDTKLKVGTQFKVRGSRSFLHFQYMDHHFQARQGDFTIEKDITKKGIKKTQIDIQKGTILFTGEKSKIKTNIRIRVPKVYVLVSYKDIHKTQIALYVKDGTTLLYVKKGVAKVTGKLKKTWSKLVKKGQMIEYKNKKSQVVKADLKKIKKLDDYLVKFISMKTQAKQNDLPK